MIQHTVVFRWTSESTLDVARLESQLRALAGTVDGVLSYHCGPDLGLREGNVDFAVAAVFSDEEAFLTYANHPVHLQIIENLINPNLDNKYGVQFRVG